MNKKPPFYHVVRGPDGRLYRVFINWNALYQFMMHDPNKHAHCAIITLKDHLALEVWEVGNGEIPTIQR